MLKSPVLSGKPIKESLWRFASFSWQRPKGNSAGETERKSRGTARDAGHTLACAGNFFTTASLECGRGHYYEFGRNKRCDRHVRPGQCVEIEQDRL